ncbi:MAG: tRNA (adenosine(37)-N6)-threonylcarbamoyltransferase complex dimerization subunit type 1 TsaB [Pseudomonadota bacterium]|jgi:tRNA threonylcarbamoyladenosine biosynthesis protein TsaB|nr:MAG: tRNA (adenosine(37)-N6)-threonylcarbamoyltransferase complex dimerization subunit type 1 TsaB [Pseudomonadota bacterium]
MKLLALDTASAQCSAALLLGDRLLVRGVPTARDHAKLLLPMVDELLAEGGVTLRGLDGIAFGRGPGSFTGLRVAAAVTQGLAAGANLPVRPVSSLRALAAQVRRVLADRGEAPLQGSLLACMDARMGEVYWGVFAPALADADEAVSPPGTMLAAVPAGIVAGAGRGFSAYPSIATALGLPPQCVLAEAEPHAADVAALAAADLAAGAPWLDATLAQPVYLRDQVAHVPRKP